MHRLSTVQVELVQKCTSEWTTQNDVNGLKFTGPNGGSIFLPAACFSWYPDYAGSLGDYWSSTLYERYPHDARGLSFDYKGGVSADGSYGRHYGLTVRPVR